MGTWTARNVGLTGDALTVHYIIINPATRHLPSVSHDLWIATNKGIYRSFNGGLQWNEISIPQPNSTVFLPKAPSVLSELDFRWIDYDPINELTLYSLASDQTNERLWIYKTTDLGLTWVSRGLAFPLS